MKIEKEQLDFIQSAIKAASLVGINNIIIEPNKVRAMDDDQSVVLFREENVPSMPFGSIGINRISVFQERLAIARSKDNCIVSFVTNGSDKSVGFDKYDSSTGSSPPMWAKSLTMTSNRMSIDYRCASPQTIKTPKNRSDRFRYRVHLTTEVLELIQKGKAAMSSEHVTFVGDTDGVSLEISDVNGDTLKFKFADQVIKERLDDRDDPDFSHTYPIKLLLPLVKNNPEGIFYITDRGFFMMNIFSFDIYIAPGA